MFLSVQAVCYQGEQKQYVVISQFDSFPTLSNAVKLLSMFISYLKSSSNTANLFPDTFFRPK